MPADGGSGSAYLTGSGPGQRWELRPGRDLTIGRLPDSDIWVDDASVSRRHAVLRLAEDGWSIGEEAPSSNGTYLNGQRLLARSVLTDGDQVVVGRAALVFHLGAVPPGRPDAVSAPAPVAADRRLESATARLPPIPFRATVERGQRGSGNHAGHHVRTGDGAFGGHCVGTVSSQTRRLLMAEPGVTGS